MITAIVEVETPSSFEICRSVTRESCHRSTRMTCSFVNARGRPNTERRPLATRERGLLACREESSRRWPEICDSRGFMKVSWLKGRNSRPPTHLENPPQHLPEADDFPPRKIRARLSPAKQRGLPRWRGFWERQHNEVAPQRTRGMTTPGDAMRVSGRNDWEIGRPRRGLPRL